VPDALVRAAARATDLLRDAVRSHVDEGWKFAAGSAVNELRAALTLPRRTEAELLAQGAADERERLAKVAIGISDRDVFGSAQMDGSLRLSVDDWVELAMWLRAQGGDNAG